MKNLETLFEAIAANKTQAIETLASDIMHTKNRHDATESDELKKLYRDIALLQIQKLKEMLTEPLEELIKETEEYE